MKKEKAKKTILIVEDDPSLMKALGAKFKREGFGVITANDGKEGLESALANKPDLIVVDVLMPVMNGMEMLKELRKDKSAQRHHIIMLSGHVTDDFRHVIPVGTLIEPDMTVKNLQGLIQIGVFQGLNKLGMLSKRFQQMWITRFELNAQHRQQGTNQLVGFGQKRVFAELKEEVMELHKIDL